MVFLVTLGQVIPGDLCPSRSHDHSQLTGQQTLMQEVCVIVCECVCNTRLKWLDIQT